MKISPETTVQTWLSRSGIRISANLLERQLKSHPDYPSLLSITDTLGYFGIENAAVQIEKDQIHEVSAPFLAHLRTNGGEFVVVENRDTVENTYPGFFKYWSGVVLVTEKNAAWQHKENEEWLYKEKMLLIYRTLAIATVLLMAVAAIAGAGNQAAALLTLIALGGISVSWMITSKGLGIENKMADRFCGNTENCNAVIKSSPVTLPFNAGWGDAGMIWFSSLLLILSLSVFAVNIAGVLNILSVLSVVGIAFTFFSVYYQWQVIKKWCRLCLITAALLLLQFLVLLTSLQNLIWQQVQIKDAFFIVSSLLFITISWLTIKALLLKYKNASAELFNGLRFKRNGIVFKTLFENQKTIDFAPWQKDLQLGSAEASLQIMVACNPYCKPCAKAHEKLHTMMEQYGDKTGLTIRFTITDPNPGSKTIKTIRHLLQHIEASAAGMNDADKAACTRHVLHQWFKTMDYESFVEKYPVTGAIDVDDTLAHYQAWTAESKIEFTPTVFINGRQLPAQYSVDDLPSLMNTFEELFAVQEDMVSEKEAALI